MLCNEAVFLFHLEKLDTNVIVAKNALLQNYFEVTNYISCILRLKNCTSKRKYAEEFVKTQEDIKATIRLNFNINRCRIYCELVKKSTGRARKLQMKNEEITIYTN